MLSLLAQDPSFCDARSIGMKCSVVARRLVSTTHDYVRFCLMLANGGELDGVRVLSSKTLGYMTSNRRRPAVIPSCDSMLFRPLQVGCSRLMGNPRVCSDLPGNQDMRGMYKMKAYSEVQGAGAGFGLGFSVVLDPIQVRAAALYSLLHSTLYTHLTGLTHSDFDLVDPI